MTKRPHRREDGKYHIHGKGFKELFGSRQQVMNGTAYKTAGELTKSHLMMNKWGRIVSRKKHATAKKEKRLLKHGYTAKKGKFGSVKIGKKLRKPSKKVRRSRKVKGGKGNDLAKEEDRPTDLQTEPAPKLKDQDRPIEPGSKDPDPVTPTEPGLKPDIHFNADEEEEDEEEEDEEDEEDEERFLDSGEESSEISRLPDKFNLSNLQDRIKKERQNKQTRPETRFPNRTITNINSQQNQD